jgi:cytochrome c5
MSDAPQHASASDAHDVHEGPIKTPKQLGVAVIASFVVPIVAIIALANYVNWGAKPAAGSTAMTPEAVAARLAPVGRVEVRDANAPVVLKTGQEVVNLACAACHVSGAAGAPKIGDAAAWAPRIKTGYEALLNSVIKGKGAMAAQGGGDYSDIELGRAVVYLVNQAGGKMAEPAVPVAAAASAAASAPN